jgi:hypothetical protein
MLSPLRGVIITAEPFTRNLLFLLALALCAKDGAAETIEQHLDTRRSSVRFALSSPTFLLEGRLKDYAGTLLLTEKDLTRSKVKIFASSAVEFAAPFEAFNQLLEKWRETVSFESTRIEKLSPDRYLVEGILRHRSRSDKTKVPVTVRRSAKGVSEFLLSATSELNKEFPALPLPIKMEGATGHIEASLIFTAVQSLEKTR